MLRSVAHTVYRFAGALLFCSPVFGLAFETATTLATNPNPSIFGTPVTLTASVTPALSIGEVFFYDGATVLGVSPLSAGTATLNVSLLASGSRSLRAYYGGATITSKFLTTIYGPSTSGSIAQMVNAQSATTFLFPANFTTDDNPAAVVAGDFNGDGKPDLAVVNTVGADVSILVSNGDGTFKTAVSYSVGNNSRGVASIAVGDFDGDHKADLVVTSSDQSSVFVLIGKGDGTFQPAVGYPAGVTPVSVVIGDFNKDGRADLAVANDDDTGTVSILIGNGNGTFKMPVSYACDADPTSVALGDFNGDGKLDLVVATPGSSTLSVLLAGVNGTFLPAVSYSPSAGGASGVIVADFDGDGRADLAVANASSNNLSILRGNGDGTFQAATLYPAGINPSSVTAADFNADGKLDLVVGNAGSDDISVFLGKGDGTFEPSMSFIAGLAPTGIAAADFNGDGKLDLAVANAGDMGFSSEGYASLIVGNGTGTFQAAADLYTPGNNIQNAGAAVGDFNGDGKADLAIAYNQGVSVALGNGNGTFQPPVSYTVSLTFNSASSVAVADFNGDDLDDLVVTVESDNSVGVLLGKGDGTFKAPLTFAVAHAPVFAAVGDFNEDGSNDLAVANSASNSVTVLLGNGDGTFKPAVDYPVGVDPLSVAVGDFNKDGNADLAVASYGGLSLAAPLSILLGNGDGTFKSAVSYSAGLNDTSVTAGDFDGDGNTDLAVAAAGEDRVYVLLGKPDGTFRPSTSFGGTDVLPKAVVAGDFDGDGKLDLASANDLSSDTSIMLGNGDGTFQPPVNFVAGEEPASIAVGQFDGDGRSDLIVANQGGTLTVLLGIRGGADSRIVKTHSGNFAQGQIGATYSMTVENGGTALTSGTVSVTDTLPPGLTATAMGGTGWICNPGAVTCTRSDALAPGGTYPAIALTVNVAGSAPAHLTNRVTVSGGGSAPGSSADVTNIVATPGTMTANAGTTPQSAPVHTAFTNAPAVTVLDGGGNPLAGVNVTFTAPGSGASGTFSNSTPAIAVATDASGIASAPFTANGTAGGPYSVTAAAAGLTSVSFTLTNTSGITSGLPEPTGVNPGAGSGTTQTFTFSFTDPAGYADLSVLDILMNNYLDGIGACYLALVPASATSGYVYLVDNAGDGGYVSGTPMLLPSSGSLTNGQCTINGSGSSVSASGDTLALTLNVTFEPGFAGDRIFYMAARSTTQNSGWQALGTWSVPGPAVVGPGVGGVTPGRSATAGQTYTFTFTDSAGYGDLAVLDILTNSFLDGISACYVAYVPTSASNGYLYLVDDAGDGGYASGSPILLSSGGRLKNSQCSINTTGSSATASGNTLNLNLPITFSSSFAGNQVFYLASRNSATGNSGWQAAGSVTVP